MNLHPNVTLFVGENGSGKSTMLEALAVANGLNAEGGSRNIQFSTRKSHSELYKALRLEKFHALIPDAWFLRAESLFNVCLLYTSPSPRDRTRSRMPSSA